MAISLNKVTLIGHLGRDPELRSTQNNNRIAVLNLATSEAWRDRRTGERQEKTEWHRIVVFNEHLIGIIERYLRKGSKIYVEGQLETRQWVDTNSEKHYTTEVILRNYRGELLLLDSRSREGDNDTRFSSSIDDKVRVLPSSDYVDDSRTRPHTQEDLSSPSDHSDLPFNDDVPF